MKTHSILWILILWNSAQALEVQGYARSRDNHKLIYIEKHHFDVDEKGLNKFISTDYCDPDGHIFARAKVDFSRNSLVPDIQFEDDRFGLKETQILNSAENLVHLSQQKKEALLTEKNISMNSTMVSGQGFDNYIKSNFSLPEKEKLNFHFVVLSKLNDYHFFVVAESGQRPNEKRFRLSPDNLFLRLLTPNIQVTYDTRTKNLLFYEGLSNILAKNGATQEVEITYERPPP